MTNFPETITPEQAPALYVKGGLAPLLEIIRAQALTEVPDVTTAKGRDRVASLAYRVSQCKTTVEKPGRAYLKYLKETLIKEAETELREFVRACDELRDQVRQPLTDIENRERARVQAHHDAIASIETMGNTPYTLKETALDALAWVEVWPVDADACQEFLPAYQAALHNAAANIRATVARLEQTALQAAQAQAERERQAAEQAVTAERLRVAQAQAEEQRKAADAEHRDRVRREICQLLREDLAIEGLLAERIVAYAETGRLGRLKIVF